MMKDYGGHPGVPPTLRNIEVVAGESQAREEASSPSMSSERGQSPSRTLTPPPIAGRIKAPPVCRVPALRKMNMSAEQLSKWCFKPDDLLNVQNEKEDSGMSKKQEHGIRVQQENNDVSADASAVADAQTDDRMTPAQWAEFKTSILQRTESRNGRDHQRFATNPRTGHLMRLTTGSVPIMSDGRILLVSSSRKEEWILPKGGWESDETCQVSALRETYEEGGILGILGPELTKIDYETRKAKKRRLELESLKKKIEMESDRSDNFGSPPFTKDLVSNSSAVSIHSTTSSICPSEEDAMQGSEHSRSNSGFIKDKENGNDGVISKILSPAHFNKINARKISQERSDADAASLGSITSDASSSCAHVRMSMFPLYVLEVREHWPESGRARKVVDIDKAIEIMQSRPEFHQVLLEVKEKGYHLRPHRIISSQDDNGIAIGLDKI